MNGWADTSFSDFLKKTRSMTLSPIIRILLFAVSMVLIHDATKAYYITANPYYKKPYIRTFSQIFKRQPQNIGARPIDPGNIIPAASHNDTDINEKYSFQSIPMTETRKRNTINRVWAEGYQRSPMMTAESPKSVRPSARRSEGPRSQTKYVQLKSTYWNVGRLLKKANFSTQEAIESIFIHANYVLCIKVDNMDVLLNVDLLEVDENVLQDVEPVDMDRLN